MRNPHQAYHLHLRKIRKDGAVVWIEEIARTVADLNGGLNILVVCQDTTKHKRAEEMLHANQEQLRAYTQRLQILI